MSDMVKRLRDYALDDHERGCQGRYYDCSCGYDGKRDVLIGEAADRIEALEAALREIAGIKTYSEVSTAIKAADIARAALECPKDRMAKPLEDRT